MNRLTGVHCTELLKEMNEARNTWIVHGVMLLVQLSLGCKKTPRLGFSNYYNQ